jgi:hypothetical protein
MTDKPTSLNPERAARHPRRPRRPLSARSRTILLFISTTLTAVLITAALQHVTRTPQGLWITEVCVEQAPSGAAKHPLPPSVGCKVTEKAPPALEQRRHPKHEGPLVIPDTPPSWS